MSGHRTRATGAVPRASWSSHLWRCDAIDAVLVSMHTDDETPTATEMRFRELLASEGLAQPDAIERRPNELVFLWHDRKLAVVVELSDDGTPRGIAAR